MSAPGSAPFAGVWPVLVTPFHDDLSLDSEGLVTQVQLCRAAGADGVVYPGVVSEFFTLSEDEIATGVSAVIKAAGPATRVIAGVSAASTPLAAELARRAQAAGAAGVMAMLPHVQHLFAPGQDFALRHYTAVAEACDIPIVLQNARMGYALGLGSLCEVVRAVPGVRYVKEESGLATHQLSAVVNALGEELDGVFGGIGGIYLGEELERGAVGTMPAPTVVEAIVQQHALWRAGHRAEAVSVAGQLAPLHTLELLYNVSLVKEVLRRRGVIRSAATRAPAPVLDAVDARAIDDALARLADLLPAR